MVERESEREIACQCTAAFLGGGYSLSLLLESEELDAHD